MGIAVATMVVFRAAMKRVDWTVTESPCKYQDYIVGLLSQACFPEAFGWPLPPIVLTWEPLKNQKKEKNTRERIVQYRSVME